MYQKMDSAIGEYYYTDAANTASWQTPGCSIGTSTVTYTPHYDRIVSSSLAKIEQKEERRMSTRKTRGLYQVILVDPKEGKIIYNGYVICSNQEDVLLEANAGQLIKEKALVISEVDKIVVHLGEIRKVKKNKDGQVELVNDEEKGG